LRRKGKGGHGRAKTEGGIFIGFLSIRKERPKKKRGSTLFAKSSSLQ